MTIDDFTPTHRRILEVLRDGMPHTRQELIDVLFDGAVSTNPRLLLNQHLVTLRKKLRPIRHEVICELVNRKIAYRHVLLIGQYVAVMPPEAKAG